MNFVDRFPLPVILAWADANNVDISAWKTWGNTTPEFISQTAMHRLYDLLHVQMPDQPLGLHIGSQCKLDTLGLFGQIGQHCKTLREGAEIYVRYQRFSAPSQTRVEFDSNTGQVSIVIAPDRDPAIASSVGFRIAFAFAQTLNMFRQVLADLTITADVVEFVCDDERFRAQYEDYFGGLVTFGCTENRIAFSGEVFDHPIAGAMPGTRVYLEEFALTQITRHSAANAPSEDFVDLLRAELRTAIPEGDFDEATIARRFSVSPRTLQRRLASQNLAFRNLVDEVQAQLAMELLAKPEFTIQEIADMLGYTQTSSFHRAFKRWTGQTPAAARRDLLA